MIQDSSPRRTHGIGVGLPYRCLDDRRARSAPSSDPELQPAAERAEPPLARAAEGIADERVETVLELVDLSGRTQDREVLLGMQRRLALALLGDHGYCSGRAARRLTRSPLAAAVSSGGSPSRERCWSGHQLGEMGRWPTRPS
jgi:hypothetical protein